MISTDIWCYVAPVLMWYIRIDILIRWTVDVRWYLDFSLICYKDVATGGFMISKQCWSYVWWQARFVVVPCISTHIAGRGIWCVQNSVEVMYGDRRDVLWFHAYRWQRYQVRPKQCWSCVWGQARCVVVPCISLA